MPNLKIEEQPTLDAVIKAEVVVTEKDKDDFFRNFLNDEPFSQDVTLFGGKLKLRFKTLTSLEDSQILSQIKQDEKDGFAEETDHYYIWISAYRLSLCLTHVDGEEFRPDLSAQSVILSREDTSLVKLRSEAIRQWPSYKLTAVIDALRYFDSKVVKLTTEVLEPNFWKAVR